MTNKFVLMSNLFTNSIYKCEADSSSSSCDGNVYAYVYPSDMSQYIYMCEFTFNYPVSLLQHLTSVPDWAVFQDYSEKVQTVIHELSHFDFIGATNDNAYGEQPIYELANGPNADFSKALLTADTYGYFAM